MKQLGKVVNFSPKGSLVVKGSYAPSIGSPVVDRRGRPIGRIIRITGPVKAPYMLVRLHAGSGIVKSNLSGSVVFLGDREPGRRKYRERGKGRRGPPDRSRKDGRQFKPKGRRRG